MNILFVSAEVAPYVSVGGLSQVMYFLPKALRKLGHDVRVFTPKYGAMDENAPKKGWKLSMEFPSLAVPLDEDPQKALICNVLSHRDKKDKAQTYFLENREYYELRANVFGYRDDHVRFALLSKGVLEWLKQINDGVDPEHFWWPDVIHCHDWHTGYFIDLARRTPRYSSLFLKTPLFFTVHNFAYQGNFDFRYAVKDDFDYGKKLLAPLLSWDLQKQNALKRAILSADAVNTVSQTHAVEVMTPEYAEGLEDVLLENREKVTGILNGLDITNFNPEKDTLIKKQYNTESFITAREENKRELQKIFGLSVDVKRPLLAVCGRLSKQKGWDLLLKVLPNLLTERPEVQVVVMGSGEDRYRLELSVLQKNFSDQLGLHLRPDFKLPRKMYAGADMILIPSLFEPGGIVALEALRYGAVPLVRRTGGLNDIVTDFNPATKIGNGFSFKNKDAWSLYGTIIEALTVYKHPSLWKRVVKNCMSCDFSWEHAAEEYNQWYQSVLTDNKTLDKHLYSSPLASELQKS